MGKERIALLMVSGRGRHIYVGQRFIITILFSMFFFVFLIREKNFVYNKWFQEVSCEGFIGIIKLIMQIRFYCLWCVVGGKFSLDLCLFLIQEN